MTTLDDLQVRGVFTAEEQVTADLAEGLSLPAGMYVDPAVLSLEQEKVFNRSWQYACHASALAKPGDYIVTQAGTTPIIVTRSRDGALNGFVNACMHRLHPLATENGHRPLLQCSYHGWTYELDGQLRSAPRSQLEPAFDCSAISLRPVSVEAWDQWIFVNPDPDARPLAELTTDVRPLSEGLNATLANYRYSERFSYDMECNWKLWAENAIECYHCPTLHMTSFGQTFDSSPDQYRIEAWEDTIWHSSPVKWLPNGEDPAKTDGFNFTFLWPGTFFAVDDYTGFIGRVYPTGPETAHAFVDMYVNPDQDPSTTAEMVKMWDQTLVEDQSASELQQIGYRSGRIEHARLLSSSELCLQAFMRRTWAALRS